MKKTKAELEAEALAKKKAAEGDGAAPDTKEDLDLDKQTENLSDPESPENSAISENTEDSSSQPDSSEPEQAPAEEITLDSGAVVKEDEHPENAEELITIEKPSGDKLYVEKVEGETPEEKKDVYEAIVDADVDVEEAQDSAEDILSEIDGDDQIEACDYVASGGFTPEASLKNSFYVFKTKAGKIKAIKAGLVLNKPTQEKLIAMVKNGQNVPSGKALFNRIASRLGYSFNKLASQVNSMAKSVKASKNAEPKIGDVLVFNGERLKITASKNGVLDLSNGKKCRASSLMKKVAESTSDIPETKGMENNEDNKQLQTFSLKMQELDKGTPASTIAIDGTEANAAKGEGVKDAKSRVKQYYSRLPGTAGVGTEVEWSLKDFNKERGEGAKPVSASFKPKSISEQVKLVREATEENRKLEASLKAKDEELKKLKAALDSKNEKEALMVKNQKIAKIIAAQGISTEEEATAMFKKYASWSVEKLDGAYEALTSSPEIEVDNMHEELSKRIAGRIPTRELTEEETYAALDNDDYSKKLLEREQQRCNR